MKIYTVSYFSYDPEDKDDFYSDVKVCIDKSEAWNKHRENINYVAGCTRDNFSEIDEFCKAYNEDAEVKEVAIDCVFVCKIEEHEI